MNILLIKFNWNVRIAIWMLPTDSVYGQWPASGEIDIVEVRSNLDFSCGGAPLGWQLAGQTMHWGPSTNQNAFQLTHWEKYVNTSESIFFKWQNKIYNYGKLCCRINRQVDFSADFHVYRVEWLLDGLQFYIDDELIGEVYPPAGGFWELGGFRGQPIWSSGTKMAPFDQRVLLSFTWLDKFY